MARTYFRTSPDAFRGILSENPIAGLEEGQASGIGILDAYNAEKNRQKLLLQKKDDEAFAAERRAEDREIMEHNRILRPLQLDNQRAVTEGNQLLLGDRKRAQADDERTRVIEGLASQMLDRALEMSGGDETKAVQLTQNWLSNPQALQDFVSNIRSGGEYGYTADGLPTTEEHYVTPEEMPQLRDGLTGNVGELQNQRVAEFMENPQARGKVINTLSALPYDKRHAALAKFGIPGLEDADPAVKALLTPTKVKDMSDAERKRLLGIKSVGGTHDPEYQIGRGLSFPVIENGEIVLDENGNPKMEERYPPKAVIEPMMKALTDRGLITGASSVNRIWKEMVTTDGLGIALGLVITSGGRNEIERVDAAFKKLKRLRKDKDALPHLQAAYASAEQNLHQWMEGAKDPDGFGKVEGFEASVYRERLLRLGNGLKLLSDAKKDGASFASGQVSKFAYGILDTMNSLGLEATVSNFLAELAGGQIGEKVSQKALFTAQQNAVARNQDTDYFNDALSPIMNINPFTGAGLLNLSPKEQADVYRMNGYFVAFDADVINALVDYNMRKSGAQAQPKKQPKEGEPKPKTGDNSNTAITGLDGIIKGLIGEPRVWPYNQ